MGYFVFLLFKGEIVFCVILSSFYVFRGFFFIIHCFCNIYCGSVLNRDMIAFFPSFFCSPNMVLMLSRIRTIRISATLDLFLHFSAF